jgi:hypothetical protein
VVAIVVVVIVAWRLWCVGQPKQWWDPAWKEKSEDCIKKCAAGGLRGWRVGGADLLGKWVLVDRPFSYLTSVRPQLRTRRQNKNIVCFGLVVVCFSDFRSLFLYNNLLPQCSWHLTCLFNSSYPVSYSSCRLALPSCFQLACTIIPSTFDLLPAFE